MFHIVAAPTFLVELGIICSTEAWTTLARCVRHRGEASHGETPFTVYR
jgi:hypothetical protein